MRFFRCAASCLIAWTLVAVSRADTPPSPLRLLPDGTDLLIQAPEPRRLVDTLTTTELFEQLRQFEPVLDLIGSTNARRSRQLVAYFEKELGLPWPQLLDRLAGRGIVLSIQFQENPTRVLLVIEGEDDKLTQQFFQLALKIVAQELVRQEAKEKPIEGSYKGFATVRIGTELHAAVAGSALFLSNSEKTLQGGLDKYSGGGEKSMAGAPGVQEAGQLLPPQPLATLWLNMTKIQKSPGAKSAYQPPPRDDPVLTVLFGHYLNLLGRTPFVCAGVYHDKEGFSTTIRMPRGREGLEADRLLHVPPAGAPGSRPLLRPKSVLYSESKYFDIANVWKAREKLFNKQQMRQLERVEKQAAPFLIGTKLSKLLAQAGPYYRLVATHQSKNGYKSTPKIPIPAFALVWELREPELFGKSMESILRGVALLTGSQANLQLVQEQYQDCKLIGYRFPEDQPLKGDDNDLRFNFTPCFTRVGDQFVVSSTIDLCRELVDLLHKEGTSPTRGHASSARVRLHGSGVAAYLRTIEDLLITQTTLDQAATPEEARQQVQTFLAIVQGLGSLTLEPRFQDQTFQYDIRLRAEKKRPD